MITAVLFDMDGVLIDSEPLHFTAARETLARYGKRFTWEMHLAFLGITEPQVWSTLVKRFGIAEDYHVLMEEKARQYPELLREQGAAIPGAVELVQRLAGTGHVQLAIGSSLPRAEIDAVLARLQITRLFSAIVSGDDVLHSKPDPEVYLQAAAALKAAPEQCPVVEDAANGVEAAKAAGMRCVAVTSSLPAERLNGADHIISELREFRTEWPGLQDTSITLNIS